MKIPKKINDVRRKLMRSLTGNIGSSTAFFKTDKQIGVEIRKVLISRPNARLGNLLLITPLVQDIVAVFPDCQIDLFVKGSTAPVIFKNYKNINRIIELPAKPFKNLFKYILQWSALRKYNYDLVINVDHHSSSGRLSSQFAKATFKIFGESNASIISSHQDYRHLAKYPVYGLREFLKKIGIQSIDGMPLLDLQLSAFELARGKYVLSKLSGNSKKTICLFTFATGEKCYPESWWMDFYEKLKNKYTNFNIVEILPMHDASQIGYKAPSFYSKDIREISAVIANTELFIGADSGMMHLAAASNTTVAGFFSVTDIEKYKPFGNSSIAIDTNFGDSNNWLLQIDEALSNSDLRKRRENDAAG